LVGFHRDREWGKDLLYSGAVAFGALYLVSFSDGNPNRKFIVTGFAFEIISRHRATPHNFTANMAFKELYKTKTYMSIKERM